LGPGGAGKSSLADRLQSKPVETSKKLTVGVDYLDHQPLNLYEKFDYLQQGDKPLDLYLWDFGGQTIFHGLHSAFLHENCVYVLVVDSRHEQAPDAWLHQIRHLAGGQAKVLLVTNWYEKCETRQNEARLLREFPDLLDERSFFYFSCHEPDAPGLQTFVQALEKACLESQRMVLKETLDVNAALQQQYQDDVFLDSADLEEIIENVTRRPESVETLPNKLEQLGFLVRVDSDDQHYCLKPAWAVDNAYAVLYSPLLRVAKGVLKLKTLQREFKGQIETQHVAYLIEFLQMRSLCRKLAGGDGYFFPDAAPADELPEASELLREKAKGLLIRFDLPYLPLGFHAALVHRLFVPGGISSTDDIWRQGFILRKDHSRAVVHYLTRKSVMELALAGEWQDFAGLLNTVLINLKAVLLEGKGIREEHIVPSVVLDQQVFSVHSAERLVDVLGQINSYGQLIREVKAMASTGNISVTNGQIIIGDNNIQKSHSDNTMLDITNDQRQQIAAIVGSLLKDAGSLAPSDLLAVAEVSKALVAPPDKPEARNLLGKVWNGLKEVVDVTKTGTDIAGFVLEHQAAIAGAITTAVALLK
jgi:GTPase SAR1 family protein